MRDSQSVHSQHSLNARLLRFRSQPQSEDAYALAEDLIEAQRYADARSVAASAQPHDRDDGSLLVLEARAHLLERDLIRAQAALLRAVKAEPRLQPAYRYLGEVLLKRGDPQRAIKTLRRALQLDPRDDTAAQLVERAQYLAEAANDSLEALPSPVDAMLDAGPAAAPRQAPASLRGQPGVEPSAPPAPGTSLPPTASDTEPAAAGPRPDLALEQQRPAPSARPRRTRRQDEPTSPFRRPGRPRESAAPSPTVSERAVPPPLPSARASAPGPEHEHGQHGPPLTAATASGATGRSLGEGRSGEPGGSATPPHATHSGGDERPAYGKRLSDFATRPSHRGRQARAERTDAMLGAEQAALGESAHGPAVDGAGRVSAAGAPGVGSEVDAPIDADHVLSVVRSLGLFEEPTEQPASWAQKSEAVARGQRMRGALVGLWSVTLVLCAAGYFGWNEWVQRRHQAAAGLVAQAHALMLRGDHAGLVDAERLLRLARAQHPASARVLEEALFLQAERVLEDGEHDMAALRSAYGRARAAKLKGPGLPLADMLIASAMFDRGGADRALSEVLARAGADARTLYLAGRAEQQVGNEAAQVHLEAAVHAQPKLAPALLALAELDYQRGERAAALRRLDAALAAEPEQLRVRLFRLLVSADDEEPAKLRQELNGLASAMRKGGSIDQALGALIRAHLARRGGERVAAVQAVEAAANSGVDVPRVLGWVAQEALALDELPLAQQLASRALSLAPGITRHRRFLADVLVQRGAGQQAFELLSELPSDDAEVQALKAQAALLAGTPDLLQAALDALPASGAKAGDTQLSALRLRIETRLEPTKGVLERARALARAAPADPEVLLALAEVALALHEPKLVQSALKRRSALMPDDVAAEVLLGRSLRMSADAAAAEAAFRRALELAPGHAEAQAALGSLLLDRGEFAQADALYRELATRDETALTGRLGRVEALIGLGQWDDARAQLQAVPEGLRDTAGYREMAARLALARGEVAEALKLLRALVEEQPKRAAWLALQADALLAASQFGAASAAYDAALAQDADLPEALLGRAELQLRSKKGRDARKTLAQAERALHQRVRPAALEARRLTLLARALLQSKRRGDADAGLKALRRATELAGAPAEVFYHYAEAISGKDKAEARRAYERYLELAPQGSYRQRAQRMLGALR